GVYDIKPPKGSANHTPGFTDAAKTEFAHEATLTASKGIALTGIDYLVDDGFARLVKSAFDAYVDKTPLRFRHHHGDFSDNLRGYK
ncbi:2292_t:CDS:2, partial [Funneliformis caledonium]